MGGPAPGEKRRRRTVNNMMFFENEEAFLMIGCLIGKKMFENLVTDRELFWRNI
jgi:hypothetical protein